MNRWFRGAGVMPLGLCGAGALLCVLEACSSSAETQSRLEHDPEDTKPEAGTDGDLSSDGADDAESPSQPYDLSVQCATKPCVTQIAARGGAHACTLIEDRSVRCWGANDSGQLGIGRADGGPTSIQEGAPRRVLDIAGAVAVAAAGVARAPCAPANSVTRPSNAITRLAIARAGAARRPERAIDGDRPDRHVCAGRRRGRTLVVVGRERQAAARSIANCRGRWASGGARGRSSRSGDSRGARCSGDAQERLRADR